MTRNTEIVIEKRQAAKLALLVFLGSLPVGAAAAIVTRGDSILWAQIERALKIPEVSAGVGFNFPGGWTNNPNGNVVISDCDCPPPAPADCDCDMGDGDGDGSDSDSC